MSIDCCPICGDKTCECTPVVDGCIHKCRCETIEREFSFHPAFLICEPKLKNRLLNVLCEYLIHHNNLHADDIFYYDESQSPQDKEGYIDIGNFLKTYPETFTERANRVLLNFSIMFPADWKGIEINIDEGNFRFSHAMFNEYDVECDGNYSFAYLLVDSGDMEIVYETRKRICLSITAAGWKKIDELKTKHKEITQGFIAMSFCDAAKPIMEMFKKSIDDCGHKPRVISEKEHNNQIVSEIFCEIERSKYVVVDVTFPNYGAYYEAGYAQALGKQVIVCCHKDVFDSDSKSERPHFDISQKAMIIWEDEKDLEQKLKRRITATVK